MEDQRTVVVGDVPYAAMWAELADRPTSESREALPKGKGWLTSKEYSDLCPDKPGESATLRRLRALREAGKIERFTGRKNYNGIVHLCFWYRPIRLLKQTSAAKLLPPRKRSRKSR